VGREKKKVFRLGKCKQGTKKGRVTKPPCSDEKKSSFQDGASQTAGNRVADQERQGMLGGGGPRVDMVPDCDGVPEFAAKKRVINLPER